MVKRSKPTASVLARLYNAVYQSIETDAAYYTSEEVERLRENKDNVFLKRGKENGAKREVNRGADGA